MEAKNITIPADFEKGDRAYFEDIDGVHFATAMKASEIEVEFQLDDGRLAFARLDADRLSIEDIKEWHRPLQMRFIEPGICISNTYTVDGEETIRYSKIVTEYVPKVKLVVRSEDSGINSVFLIEGNDENETDPLEHFLREWELEG